LARGKKGERRAPSNLQAKRAWQKERRKAVRLERGAFLSLPKKKAQVGRGGKKRGPVVVGEKGGLSSRRRGKWLQRKGTIGEKDPFPGKGGRNTATCPG